MVEVGEKCAVFGVYGKGLDASRLSFFGLYALQHRGQESSGIAVSDGERIACHKGMGLVSQVYAESDIAKLTGHLSIGHNRYSTARGSFVEHAQPVIVDDSIALAHNGNLPTTDRLEAYLKEKGMDASSFTDSRMVAEAIGAAMRAGADLAGAVREVYPLMTGAFSLLVMSKTQLIAIRDACGIRPLALAKLNGGYVLASETCALPPIGAEYIREVEPGEMVVIDESGLKSEQLAEKNQKLDVFEFVYFARHDSQLLGQSVYEVRKRFGAELAKESTLEVDIVVPVPETAVPAAIGYSQATGVPLEMALAKNRYIHRTFIQPEQHMREQGVKAKLTPIPTAIRGKRLAVFDDSIVRGTTSREIVRMLFEAGAAEVHFLVSSPPVKYPDFYGIDTPLQKDLIAATKTIEEMRAYLGATSLTFLSYDGMVRATGVAESELCTSCFTGIYPIDIGARRESVQHVA